MAFLLVFDVATQHASLRSLVKAIVLERNTRLCLDVLVPPFELRVQKYRRIVLNQIQLLSSTQGKDRVYRPLKRP